MTSPDETASPPVAARRLPRPSGLAAVTWIYVAWSLLPVLLAIRFAFNEGRSRTSLAGLLAALVLDRPDAQRAQRPDAVGARCEHSLVLAGLAMLIATPLGHRAGDRPAALARPRLGRLERA